MGKVTFVVEFEDGQNPPVHFNQDILGGKLSAVLWSDYRDDLFSYEEVEAIEGIFDDSEYVETWCEELKVDIDEIVVKLRLLTI